MNFRSFLLCFTGLGLSLLPASTPAQTQSPPTGFGRFGRINDDGLLTLNVTPHGFRVPEMFTPLEIQFGDGKGTASVLSLDSTGKRLRIENGSEGEPAEIHYSLLYPGFSATFGKTMRLRIVGATAKPVWTLFPLEAKKEGEPGGAVIVQAKGGIAIAVLIKARKGAGVTSVSSEGNVFMLNASFPDPIGEVRFITIDGLESFFPKDQKTEREDRRLAFWKNVPIPEREKVEYALTPDRNGVLVTETFKVQPEGETISPLPPVLAFAIKRGYPAKVEGKLIYPGCLTKYGEYAYVKGNVLRYTLPLPPMEEHGYVRRENAPASRVALLNSLVGHLGGDWVKNGVDLAYAGMTNAQMAWTYLSEANKAALASAWKASLPSAFRLPPYESPEEKSRDTWKLETEPFSRRSYYWTYFIHGPGPYRYDLDWGNALPLYGLYKYAVYTGDWETVQKNWRAAQTIYRYFDLGDDWAWMTVVNSDTGYSTGTGDPLAAAFCGNWAMLRMARVLEDRAAETQFAYRLARCAVPATLRFAMTPWARENGLVGKTSQILGFSEKAAFVAVPMGKDDPWNVSSVLSGDGSLPELFDAMIQFDRKSTRRYLEEYAQFYPDWFKPDVKYPFHTNYEGNSVYVTFPHLQLRSLLNLDSTETLWKYAETAEKNRNNAWVGPNVVGELLSREAPLTLTNWTPAAYLDGWIDRDSKRITLQFDLTKYHEMLLTAHLKPGVVPKTFLANGQKFPFTVKDGRLTSTIAGSGKIKIEIGL